MRRRSPSLRLALLVLCLVTASTALASAGDDGLDAARERFALARRLEDQGRWAEALEELQKVARVRMTPPLRFHIALCTLHLGLLTEARAGFELAAREAGAVIARGAADVEDRKAVDAAVLVVQESREHLVQLERRIPRVTLRVTPGAQGSVRLDGRKVPIGRPTPVNPGAHSAELLQEGEVLARVYFTVAEGAEHSALLAPTAPAARPATGARPRGARATSPTGGPPDPGRVPRTAGHVALAVGAVGTVGLGVAGVLYGGARSEFDERCPTRVACPAELQRIESDGRTYATLVNVFGAIAVAGLASGAALVVLAPARDNRGDVRITARAGTRAGGIEVGGAF